MLLVPKDVGDIPVFRSRITGGARAMLDVSGSHLLLVSVAIDVGSHHRSCDCATCSGEVLVASVSDLVTENPADQSADNRLGCIRPTLILYYFLTLNSSVGVGPRFRVVFTTI